MLIFNWLVENCRKSDIFTYIFVAIVFGLIGLIYFW